MANHYTNRPVLCSLKLSIPHSPQLTSLDHLGGDVTQTKLHAHSRREFAGLTVSPVKLCKYAPVYADRQRYFSFSQLHNNSSLSNTARRNTADVSPSQHKGLPGIITTTASIVNQVASLGYVKYYGYSSTRRLISNQSSKAQQKPCLLHKKLM